jgi:hypothetical protein
VAQAISNRIVNRFVDTGAIAGPSVGNRPLKDGTIAGEISQEPDVAIERHDHDAVLSAQLPAKGQSRLLNILKAVADARTDIEHQRNIEGDFVIAKESYLLPDSILINVKVVF